MRPIVRLSAIAAAAAMLASAAFAQQPEPARADLTVAQIVLKLESLGYAEIDEIEKDDGVWEVDATAPNGTRVELHLDPKDGRILREERDDDDD